VKIIRGLSIARNATAIVKRVRLKKEQKERKKKKEKKEEEQQIYEV